MPSDCPIESGECLAWAHKYLLDCVCNLRDEISLALGLASVFSWGVAEVPQIITNFREKSTEGVSLAFLMTWVVGDVFNLAGCWLEPATLPTQFYMAILYTFTTIILVLQTVYYDYIAPRKYVDETSSDEGTQKPAGKIDIDAHIPSRPIKDDSSPTPDFSTIINVPRIRRMSSKDLYYTSARSLASSHTPTAGSYLVGSRGDSGGKGHGFLLHSEGSTANLADDLPVQHEPSSPPAAPSGSSRSRNSARASAARTIAGASVLLVGSFGLSMNLLSGESSSRFAAGVSGGRRLLQSQAIMGSRSGHMMMPNFLRDAAPEGPWGEVFGWCMAAIYMCGRLPQILLNIKRGTVEGLNPLMFIFALVGNATYVSSILVRTLEWASIKPNMPWLVDAGVCVALDCFIICQFVYYTYRTKNDLDKEENKKGDYHLVQ